MDDTRWYSVQEEGLPAPFEPVLVWADWYDVESGYVVPTADYKKAWRINGERIDISASRVTHWRKMPSPPEV